MQDFLLFIHSYLRWAILFLGIYLIVIGFNGISSGKIFTKGLNVKSAIFTGLFHLQILIGLIMYLFTSPITQSAFSDFGAAMKESTLRFWAVEHIFVMVIAAVLVQIGRIKIKKASEDRSKFKAMAVFFLIALILVLSRIPWDAERLLRGI